MRIVVTGKHGQVVTALKAAAPHGVTILPLGRPECDLAQPNTLTEAIEAMMPDVIISAAAYTAVDKAESEPDLAHTINGLAPEALSHIARELHVPILHLSTDYVFDGSKVEPYEESDATGPVSVYGATKLQGENGIRHGTDNHVILRTAWVYSPYGANFVKTMLRLSETRDEINVVCDQHGCPTSALDIAAALIEIAHKVRKDTSPHLRGTFHLTAPDEASWAGFAEAIFAGQQARADKGLGGKAITVHPIPTSAYPMPARRPANSRLNGAKLKAAYGIELPSWRLSLQTVLDQLIA